MGRAGKFCADEADSGRTESSKSKKEIYMKTEQNDRYMNKQTDRETDRQTDRQIDRQTDRQTDNDYHSNDIIMIIKTDRQTDRQTDRETMIIIVMILL